MFSESPLLPHHALDWVPLEGAQDAASVLAIDLKLLLQKVKTRVAREEGGREGGMGEGGREGERERDGGREGGREVRRGRTDVRSH